MRRFASSVCAVRSVVAVAFVVGVFCCAARAGAFSFGAKQPVSHVDPHAQTSTPARDAALARVDAALAASDVKDATVVVGSGDGEFVVFVKGGGGTDVVYEADSAQKWIMATMLLRDARRRGVTLEQKASTWPGAPSWATGEKGDCTLREFLSFTSGFDDPPPCASIARGSWAQCAPKLTASKLTTPRRYRYGTHHMMVALDGLSAGDHDAHPSDTLLRTFQRETKLLPTTKHDSDKPLSLLITPREYAEFLRALSTHRLLTADEEQAMYADQIGDTEIARSPAERAEAHGRITGTWHYGLGNWVQCEKGQPCGRHHHSAGARGFYPFVDLGVGDDRSVYGVIAHNAGLGDWDASHALYLAIRDDLPLITRP